MQGHAGRIPVLVNPAAGRRGATGRRRVEHALSANGIDAELRVLAAGELPDAVTKLCESGASVVAVAGGDGTVRAAAELLAGGSTALAVLPTGTLNHFARRLGMGRLESAAVALARGRTIRVPVGLADDRFFLNTATFGQYAAVVRRRERLRRWIGKWPAAAFAFARVLRRLEPIALTMDGSHGRIERVSPLLWIGLGHPSFSGFRRADTPADAESLEVVTTRVHTRRAGFALLARLFARGLYGRSSQHDRAIEVVRTRSLMLREPAEVEATLDGEVFTFRSPVSIGLVPDALQVVVPAVER